MKLPSVAGICCIATTLMSCSDSDTVVALNFNSSQDVGFLSRIHVKITQSNGAATDTDLEKLPTRVVGVAGATQNVVQSQFYRRLTLPNSFEDGATTIDAEAFAEDGSLYQHPEPIIVDIEKGKTTAAFIDIGMPPAPTPAGGSAGAAGANNAGAGNEAGVSTGSAHAGTGNLDGSVAGAGSGGTTGAGP